MAKKRPSTEKPPPPQRWAPASPLTQIWSRAMYDADFRARLMADPRATLEKDLGLVLPEQMTIKVVENTAKTYTIALPAPAGEGDDDTTAVGVASRCYVYHIPEHNFAVDLRLDDVKAKPGTRGFGQNPFPPTGGKAASTRRRTR